MKAPQQQQQQPTLVRLSLSDESFIRIRPLRRNHVWRCSLVHIADGSAVRILVIIDEFTRECLKMVVARSLGSKELLEALGGLFVEQGIPEYIRPDNGPEFAAKAVLRSLARVDVKTLFVEPEGPRENGYDQAFIGKMGDELHNREVFETFQVDRVLMELGPYDELKPHGSLSSTPPAPVRGESSHGAPQHEEEEHVLPAHLEIPREGAVTGIEERGSDLPVAPSRGDGDHDALQAGGGEAGGEVPSAHLQAPHETAPLEIEEQEFDLLEAPVRGEDVHDAPRAGLEEVAGDGPLEEIELLRRGAEKGLSGFQLELGERYAKGVKGVSKDSAEARKWLTRALHDPEFPEHKDQAAALLNGLKNVTGAGPGKAASRAPWTATARLGSLKTWHVIAAIAAAAIAVLLWVNR